MRYYLAPMEGVTTAVYRAQHHAFFGGVDKYFIPFITPTTDPKFTTRQLREVAPEHNAGLPAVPQLLTKSADDFIWAAQALRALGYGEINLNLGCPSGTVVAKGKGAGFLAHPDDLDRFLDAIFTAVPGPISVKTRLGLREADEFPALLAIYNRYPIAELTVHPRVRTDYYKGAPNLSAFSDALAESRNPVCYNGDLNNVHNCEALTARFPAVPALMLGRGLVADPALARKAQGGAAADRKTLAAFHDALYEGYCRDFGNERNAVMRMKEYWSYHIHLYKNGEKYGKRIRKSTSAADYRAAAAAVFRDLEPLPAVTASNL